MITASHYAEALVRLLLRADNDWLLVHPPHWDLLRRFARRGGVLVRVADRLAEIGVRPAPVFRASAELERRRVAAALALIQRVEDACHEAGLDDFVFAKAFRHFPDISTEVDLLTLAPPRAINPVLERALGVAPQRGLAEWVAHASTFRVRGAGAELDVCHGRLGVLGEHVAYAAALVRSRRRITVGDTAFHTAAPEHQLVLQGMLRVYGHRSFRLADVIYTVRAIREGVDWDTVLRGARATGTESGLSCYLSYVDRIHQRACDAPLLDPVVAAALVRGNWGDTVFENGHFGFPAVRVGGGLYVQFLAHALGRGDWRTAARVTTMLPLAAVGVMTRALAVRN